jgi:hypothetical protein
VRTSLLTGWATLHGENLTDTPYAVHPGHESWWALAARGEGQVITQRAARVAHLRGTRFGDVPPYAAEHGEEGLLVYLGVADLGALDIARTLHAMRLAGWFDHARAVLIGRTYPPDAPARRRERPPRAHPVVHVTEAAG